jgi:hypothetical protein
MSLFRIPLRTFASLATFAFAVTTHAQQPMGTVATEDAVVTGGLEVQNGRAALLTNASVTARDHTANIALHRGGEVLVCSTSEFHLLHSGTGPSLLFGLDRGAIEIHSASAPQDVVLTPDIRFTVESPGTFDLRLRVIRNGDTCVENAGPNSPVLTLSDAFSSSSYRLIPGQHVLFEHGSLKEVVDNERDPCGCPVEKPVPTPGQLLAEAAHPFPTAVSQDLAPAPPAANTAPAGEKHTQIATTFSYAPGAPPPPSTEPAPAPPAPTATAPPPTPPGAHDIVHAIGHFFHKLFHGSEKPS